MSRLSDEYENYHRYGLDEDCDYSKYDSFDDCDRDKEDEDINDDYEDTLPGISIEADPEEENGDYDEASDTIQDADESINLEEAKPLPGNSDWEMDGLDKTYKDASFDLAKAQMLFNKKIRKKPDIKAQREAVRYANFYARKGNDEAKNFIVSVIQAKDKISKEVLGIAYNSFTLFFRNYVRVEIEKYYLKQPIPPTERFSRVREVVQECFVYITKNLDRYNPSKGKLTTFYTGMILRGIAMEYEAKRKGRGSKQTMKTDKAVVHAQQELAADGIAPTVRQIAMRTGKNVDVIINSKIRMAAENTMGTIDAPDFNNTGGKKAQSVFAQPEISTVEKESITELIKKITELPSPGKEVFLLTEGFDISTGTIIETEPMQVKDIAKALNLPPDDVRFHYNIAKRKLKSSISNKAQGPDKLLSGRQMTFTREGKEESVIDDIVSVI